METEVKRVVAPTPSRADSWDVASTEGVIEATTDAGPVVVEAAPTADLVVDVTWAVVTAVEDRVSGVLVAASDPLVTGVGPLVIMFSVPVGLFGGFGL